jgi:hypothetical protein
MEEGMFHLSTLLRFAESAGEQMDPKNLNFTFALVTLIELSTIQGALNAIEIGQAKFAETYYPRTENIDGVGFFGFALFPFYVYFEFIAASTKPSLTRLALINGAFLLSWFGGTYSSRAVEIGTSTRVVAITKSSAFMVIPVMAVIYQKVPNALEVLAIICGLSGVIVLGMNEIDEIEIRK